MDAFGRKVDYLRISVTDRCDERCLYCRPAGYRGWVRQPEHLTSEEITRVAGAAVKLGFRKFRLTGGEPLLRADLPGLVRALADLPGVEHLGLSTNGTRLARLARPLREAGLRTVNVSLDALDPVIYRRITGGEVSLVLAGLRAARAADFQCVKLNCVLLRGLTESQLWPLVLFAAEEGLPLRLIELMPVSVSGLRDQSRFLGVAEVMNLLGQRDELIPQPDRMLGWGPARYYRLRQTGALVGFIGAMTTPHFCATCNKLRLTADGKLRPCLGDRGEIPLRAVLRGGDIDEAIREKVLIALQQKPWAQQFCEQDLLSRPMTALGG
jgi:GTP 3',8-cyclase